MGAAPAIAHAAAHSAPPPPLTATGDCRKWLDSGDWARAVVCAEAGGDAARPLLALGLEQIGRFDAAAAVWLAWSKSAHGTANLEANRRANALARVEDGLKALARGKARAAANALAVAQQTFARQAGERAGMAWLSPQPVALAQALALLAARKKRPASKTLSAMTGKGRAAAQGRLHLARLGDRKARRGPWPLIERTLGGAGDDAVNAVAKLTGGDLLLAGRKQVAGDDGIQLHVWRVDAAGRLRWQQSFGAAGRDEAHALLPLADGGWLAAGETAGVGDRPDAWVVRFAADRQVRWQKAVGGSGSDRAIALLPRPDGGALVVVAADRDSPAGDMALLQISAGGQPSSMARLGGPGEQVPSSALADKRGILLGGRDRQAKGPWRGVIAAIDRKGAQRWQVQMKPGHATAVDALAAGRRGAALAFGRIWPKADAPPRLLLAGVDARGRLRWQRTEGRLRGARPVAALALGRGETAVLTSGQRDKSPAHVWLLGYKRGGRLRWQAPLGASGADVPRAMLAGGRKRLIAVGATSAGGRGNSDGSWTLLRR